MVSTNSLNRKMRLRAFDLTQNSCYLLLIRPGLDSPPLGGKALWIVPREVYAVHSYATSHGYLKSMYVDFPACQVY